MILRNVHKLKENCILVIEDFHKKTTDLRKGLLKKVKQLLSEGKISCLNYPTVVTKRRNNEG